MKFDMGSTTLSSLSKQTQGPSLPLWALAWRARSAAWLLNHRTMLEHTIEH